MEKPLILISNDDGIGWQGIRALTDTVRQLYPDADVAVVAPLHHQSAKSSAITVGMPLIANVRHDEPHYRVIAVDGTPADCVKLAISKLLPRRPDVVLTGINHGFNSGTNTIYSGTMGAALEAVIHHVPAVAFSYSEFSPDCDMTVCVPVIKEVLSRVMPAIENGTFPKDICLNVNVPKVVSADELRGIIVTKADMGRWVHEFEEQVDPYGRTIYWTKGHYTAGDADDHDTDTYLLGQGYATVVPCQVDQTATAALPSVTALLSDIRQ